jgi:hypothetical protein
MRKVLGVVFAASLVVSLGVAVSGPAGSAANTKVPKCKSLQGTETFNPGLPVSSSSKTVKPVTTTNLTITGCTGGPITSGKSKGSTKATKATNCKMLFANAGKPAAPTKGTIVWSNKQTTTTSNTLTVTGVNKDGTLSAKLVSKYTAGLGRGKTSTVIVKATPNSGWCKTKPFTSTKFKSTSIK